MGVTLDDLKKAVTDLKDANEAKHKEYLAKFASVQGLTKEQATELFESMKADVMKQVTQSIPTSFRDAIAGVVPPAEKEKRVRLNKALRFMLTHNPSAIRADSPDAKELQDLGIGLRMGDRIIIARKDGADFSLGEKALSTATGAGGAYLIPTEMREEIILKTRKFSHFENICDVLDNPPPKGQQPRESGGVTFYWNMENKKITPSNPSWDQLVWSLIDVTGLVDIPNQLINWAAFDVLNYISQLFARDLAVELDSQYMNGSGSGRPLGLRNSAGVGTVAQAGADLVYTDLNALRHTLNARYRGRAVWMAHDDIVELSENLEDNDGRPLFYDLNMRESRGLGNISDDANQIQGFMWRKPVYAQDDIPTDLGAGSNESEVWYFDPMGYRIWKGEMEITASSEAGEAFERNQTKSRMIHYVDAKLTLPEFAAYLSGVK